MNGKRLTTLFVIIIVSACVKQAQSIPPTAALSSPTKTSALLTETPAQVPTETPTETLLVTDPALFGAITQGEIQAFSLEPIANVIFNKVMDGFIADGNILDYHVTRVTIFPTGDGALLAEITYNVRTTDVSWLADGGTQAGDDWINDKCNRFDFVTTETEFQLKNRRTCN
jgi:hypothetical protein